MNNHFNLITLQEHQAITYLGKLVTLLLLRLALREFVVELLSSIFSQSVVPCLVLTVAS